MGDLGFSILTWDSWGSGLVRVNARLLSNGLDLYGNPNNWFSVTGDEKDKLIKELTKDILHWVEIDYDKL